MRSGDPEQCDRGIGVALVTEARARLVEFGFRKGFCGSWRGTFARKPIDGLRPNAIVTINPEAQMEDATLNPLASRAETVQIFDGKSGNQSPKLPANLLSY